MAAADCCILRAGAVTCAEVCAVGTASILVPYPFAAHDHQTYNAKSIADKGGALFMSDDDVKAGKLIDLLKDTLADRELQNRLRQGSKAMAMPDTASIIATSIDEVISKKN